MLEPQEVYSRTQELEAGPTLGYTTPLDMDVFAVCHPAYNRSNRIHKRMWDAVADYQDNYGSWHRNEDGTISANALIYDRGYRELFKIAPTDPALRHYKGASSEHRSPDVSYGVYFGTAVYFNGVELNLDTLMDLLTTGFVGSGHVDGIGPKSRALVRDYLEFRDGKGIELGRNNYTQPFYFHLPKIGRQVLSVSRQNW